MALKSFKCLLNIFSGIFKAFEFAKGRWLLEAKAIAEPTPVPNDFEWPLKVLRGF